MKNNFLEKQTLHLISGYITENFNLRITQA